MPFALPLIVRRLRDRWADPEDNRTPDLP